MPFIAETLLQAKKASALPLTLQHIEGEPPNVPFKLNWKQMHLTFLPCMHVAMTLTIQGCLVTSAWLV